MSEFAGAVLDAELDLLRENAAKQASLTVDLVEEVLRLGVRVSDLVSATSIPAGENDVAEEKSYTVSESFTLSLEELEEIEGLLYLYGENDSLRSRIGEECLVREARATLVDKRPVQDLTPLQKAGRKSAIKGAKNELAVVRALNNLETPEWMWGARGCTEDEDRQGIDVVVSTDVGAIYLQVKSSYDNAKKFQRKWPQRNVGMVVVRPQDAEETVFNKAMDSTAKKRSEVLKATK